MLEDIKTKKKFYKKSQNIFKGYAYKNCTELKRLANDMQNQLRENKDFINLGWAIDSIDRISKVLKDLDRLSTASYRVKRGLDKLK